MQRRSAALHHAVLGSSLRAAMTRVSGPTPGLGTGSKAPHHIAASPHSPSPTSPHTYAAHEGKAGAKAFGVWTAVSDLALSDSGIQRCPKLVGGHGFDRV